MYNNKRNAPSWPFLLSVIVSDVSDLSKSFPSCPWASPSIWLDVEVINLTWLSWEQLWHHRWSLNFTTGPNKWVWWPVRRESLCLSQSQAYPGLAQGPVPPEPSVQAQNSPWLQGASLGAEWGALGTGKRGIISWASRLENQGGERISSFTSGHREDLRQSPELCSGNSAGAAGDAEWGVRACSCISVPGSLPQALFKTCKRQQSLGQVETLLQAFQMVQNFFAL